MGIINMSREQYHTASTCSKCNCNKSAEEVVRVACVLCTALYNQFKKNGFFLFPFFRHINVCGGGEGGMLSKS